MIRNTNVWKLTIVLRTRDKKTLDIQTYNKKWTILWHNFFNLFRRVIICNKIPRAYNDNKIQEYKNEQKQIVQ